MEATATFLHPNSTISVTETREGHLARHGGWGPVLPALSDFIAVESQSPLFDPEWETNGLLDKSVAILVEWVRAQEEAASGEGRRSSRRARTGVAPAAGGVTFTTTTHAGFDDHARPAGLRSLARALPPRV